MRKPKTAEAFRIWQGGLSKEWFAGWGRRRFPDDPDRQDLWEQVGEWRADVTGDMRRIIAAHGGDPDLPST